MIFCKPLLNGDEWMLCDSIEVACGLFCIWYMSHLYDILFHGSIEYL